MSDILVGRVSDCVFSPETLRKLFSFRDRPLSESLEGDICRINSAERDRFDNLDPVYVLSRDSARQVNACWRMLPTTGPYMLRLVFPYLLDGARAPASGYVWELSRLAMRLPADGRRRHAVSVALTMELLGAAYRFAVAHDIREYVTILTPAMERRARRAGLPVERIGRGNPRRVGGSFVVACRIAVNEKARRAIWPSEAGRVGRVAA